MLGQDGTLVELDAGGGLKLRVRGNGALARGAPADAFIRPEAITLARTPAELPPGQGALSGEVTDMLFDGANSTVLLREAQSRLELRIALPQTGAFADLRPGARICFGFDPERAICFPGQQR